MWSAESATKILANPSQSFHAMYSVRYRVLWAIGDLGRRKRPPGGFLLPIRRFLFVQKREIWPERVGMTRSATRSAPVLPVLQPSAFEIREVGLIRNASSLCSFMTFLCSLSERNESM